MQTKYIFVTGGVVSGIGKGITSASIGCLLKARGYKVRNQKFDPYINIDPGLMSPYQHGEVFVTEDGAETDLNIGHYERFTDVDLDSESDITSGMIYRDVIAREREGGYLGTTVQVVPHIIDEIKKHVFRLSNVDQPDIVITEIGGTIGDMESLPFLESIRQVSYLVGHENVIFVHVTLIPYLRKAGEIKTKPTQHSVQKLLSLGIQPDILVCRSELPLERAVREKIALFCNVGTESVIQNLDTDSVYKLPLMLEAEGLGRAICSKLKLTCGEPDLTEWQRLADRFGAADADGQVTVALVGKYIDQPDAYRSAVEAVRDAGVAAGRRIDIRWVSAEAIETDGAAAHLDGAAAILVPGGFGPRGMNGMVAAAGYARICKVPFLGIGLGMQMAVVDFARHVANMPDAHSEEIESDCQSIFVLPPEAAGLSGSSRPMRRGACACQVLPGTRLAEAYDRPVISERHHHRRDFCNDFRDPLAKAGLVFSGLTLDGSLVEAVELPDHPWFVGVQYHPEFKSRPIRPHPLFTAFIGAALGGQPKA